MSSHPDADAFLKCILANPAEVTTRLAFADWLEETGGVSNLAWAYFIRLNAEIGNLPPGAGRERLITESQYQLPLLRATLRIPASLFVAYPRSFFQLLPAERIVVRLSGFSPAGDVTELVGGDLARAYRFFPLAIQATAGLVAFDNRDNFRATNDLEMVLRRRFLAVLTTPEDLAQALGILYPPPPTETPFDILADVPGDAHRPGRIHNVTTGAEFIDRVLATGQQYRANVISFVHRDEGVQLLYRTPYETIADGYIPQPEWRRDVLPELRRRGEVSGHELVVDLVHRGSDQEVHIRLLPLSYL